MKSCSACGYLNELTAEACTRCGFRFAKPPALQAVRSRTRARIILISVAFAASAAIGGRFVAGQNELIQLRTRLASELSQLQESYEHDFQTKDNAERTRVAAEEATHQARLQNHAVISGELARANHSREWARRLAHDPEFAYSAIERSILKMQKVGADPTVAAKEALEEVARLAAPPGSRVEVTNAHDKFAVRVAFKLSATTTGESGTRTKHSTLPSLRREAERISALVIKDLYDHCGARGIARLSVSCNRAVYSAGYIPEAATEAERKELEKRGKVVMSCIYRMTIDSTTADAVPSWRSISVSRVLKLARTDYDGIKNLKMGQLPADHHIDEDPNMQLEF